VCERTAALDQRLRKSVCEAEVFAIPSARFEVQDGRYTRGREIGAEAGYFLFEFGRAPRVNEKKYVDLLLPRRTPTPVFGRILTSVAKDLRPVWVDHPFTKWKGEAIQNRPGQSERAQAAGGEGDIHREILTLARSCRNISDQTSQPSSGCKAIGNSEQQVCRAG
jgi:hypothetical protein